MDQITIKAIAACIGVVLCTVLILVAGIGIAKFTGDVYDEKHKHG